jgi:ABC-type nitrate/sulfonate/bicarbonate transport system substrate-binding protein
LKPFLLVFLAGYEPNSAGFNYSLFLTDKIPAQWAFTTTAGLTLREQGHELSEISPADYGIITHGHTIIVNERIITEKPELVKRFLAAIIEATEYSLQNF